MEKKTLQIDVIGQVEGTDLMKCKLYVDGRVCVIGMSRYDYEELMREKVFIRDGKSVDSAGRINTTNDFVEKIKTQINKKIKKRTIQIDVIGQVEESELMKCKLYVDGRVCVIGMSRYDYEELMREKIFIRDGKSVDTAGRINTTNDFVEEE